MHAKVCNQKHLSLHIIDCELLKGTRLQNKDILLDTIQTSSLDNMLIEGCIQKVKNFSAMQ